MYQKDNNGKTAIEYLRVRYSDDIRLISNGELIIIKIPKT